MRTQIGVILGLVTSLLVTGCYGPEAEAAIVTSVTGHEADGKIFFSGNWCVPVVPGGHDVGNNPAGAQWALRGLSSQGEFDQSLYIRPPGDFPHEFVDEENGELAMEWTFTADSFGADGWETDDIETHHGETMFVSHWGADPDCEDPDPPEGFDYPW